MTYSIYFEVGVVDGGDGMPTIIASQVVGNPPYGRYTITGHLHNADPGHTDAGDLLSVSVPNGGAISGSFPAIASRPPTLPTPQESCEA